MRASQVCKLFQVHVSRRSFQERAPAQPLIGRPNLTYSNKPAARLRRLPSAFQPVAVLPAMLGFPDRVLPFTVLPIERADCRQEGQIARVSYCAFFVLVGPGSCFCLPTRHLGPNGLVVAILLVIVLVVAVIAIAETNLALSSLASVLDRAPVYLRDSLAMFLIPSLVVFYAPEEFSLALSVFSVIFRLVGVGRFEPASVSTCKTTWASVLASHLDHAPHNEFQTENFVKYGVGPEEDSNNWNGEYGPEEPEQQIEEVAHFGTVVKSSDAFQCDCCLRRFKTRSNLPVACQSTYIPIVLNFTQV
ncbi:hypothetical protein PGQ11_006040 [Apiospora arundinis]|uniref:Uncharacterized protein n=1 Tax=Apiospora arundinis TaxID=335852 RepID=A0ABR2IS67_9PEZI